MYLGIEIGGTKLQVGAGEGNGGPLTALARDTVEPEQGAAGILKKIRAMALPLIEAHRPTAVGVGFGGPLLTRSGITLKSHHIRGWDNFPLAAWCQEHFKLPAAIRNDADTAGLAEALYGAGRGADPVLYVTVGTGIGGGLIVRGDIYPGSGRGALEIGHLRAGLEAEQPDSNLESSSAGWGIASVAAGYLTQLLTERGRPTDGRGNDRRPQIRAKAWAFDELRRRDADDLLVRCGGKPDKITTHMIGDAAGGGNRLAQEILADAVENLGWGLAQAITLVAPQRVVIGGGVSLLGDFFFFRPLREHVQRFVFPPFVGTFEITPAELGEEVVIHGALAVAKQAADAAGA